MRESDWLGKRHRYVRYVISSCARAHIWASRDPYHLVARVLPLPCNCAFKHTGENSDVRVSIHVHVCTCLEIGKCLYACKNDG